MKKSHTIALVFTAVLMVVSFTQITIFVVPPIGAIPDGGTIIMSRLNNTKFIDSPDAMCERTQGGVSLWCRAIALGAVANASIILLRLPYSDLLYSLSTGGKSYDR
jgi:hypothetical protein